MSKIVKYLKPSFSPFLHYVFSQLQILIWKIFWVLVGFVGQSVLKVILKFIFFIKIQ